MPAIYPFDLPAQQLPQPTDRLSDGFLHALPAPVGLWMPSKLAQAAADFTPLPQKHFGTLSGGITTTPGGFGTLGAAWTTDGSTGVANCGTPAGLNGAANATLCGVISRSSTSMTAGFGGSAGSLNTGPRFSLIWYSDGNIYFQAESSISGSAFGKCALTGTGIHFVAMAFNGAGSGNAGRLVAYIDGQPQTLTFTHTIPASLGLVGPITIGKDSSDRFCGGSYLMAGLWTGQTLSAAQVSQLYNALRTGEPFPLFQPQTVAMMFGSAATAPSLAPWYLTEGPAGFGLSSTQFVPY